MKFLLFFFIAASIFVDALSLKCYECKNCEEPFKPTSAIIRNCESIVGLNLHCQLIVKQEVNGSFYVRRCVNVDDVNVTYGNVTFINAKSYINFCHHDLCNVGKLYNDTMHSDATLSLPFTVLIISLIAFVRY